MYWSWWFVLTKKFNPVFDITCPQNRHSLAKLKSYFHLLQMCLNWATRLTRFLSNEMKKKIRFLKFYSEKRLMKSFLRVSWRPVGPKKSLLCLHYYTWFVQFFKLFNTHFVCTAIVGFIYSDEDYTCFT